MKCKVCRGASGVIASRKEGRSVIRRRQCYRCGNKWNTKEVDYFGDRRKRQKRPVDKPPKPPKDPFRIPAPPMDMRVPREQGHHEDMMDALREAGIDYEWSEDF